MSRGLQLVNMSSNLVNTNKLLLPENPDKMENLPPPVSSTLTGYNPEKVKVEEVDFTENHTPLFTYCELPHSSTSYEQPRLILKGKTLVSVEPDENEELPTSSSVRNSLRFPTSLENSVSEVANVLIRGCCCTSKNCLIGLIPAAVYRHRFNISTLSDSEHFMFLTGAVIGCLLEPNRPKQRMVMKYAYFGKRVCKDAFRYLYFCTSQQLRDVRDHLVYQGITSTKEKKIALKEIDKHLTGFLSKFVNKYVGLKDVESGEPILMPAGISKKNLHNTFQKYSQLVDPKKKVLSYNMFSRLLTAYFSHIVFFRSNLNTQGSSVATHHENKSKLGVLKEVSPFSVIPPPSTRYENSNSLGASTSSTVVTFTESAHSSSTVPEGTSHDLPDSKYSIL